MKAENIMLVAVVLVVGAFTWEMFTDQLEHAESYKGKTFVANYNLEIPLLEEIVKQEPKNHTAWKYLGNRYYRTFDFVKAKEAWALAKSLKNPPKNESTERVRAMLGPVEHGQN